MADGRDRSSYELVLPADFGPSVFGPGVLVLGASVLSNQG